MARLLACCLYAGLALMAGAPMAWAESSNYAVGSPGMAAASDDGHVAPMDQSLFGELPDGVHHANPVLSGEVGL